MLPDEVGPAERLIDRIVTGALDAVTFTSPSAVRGVFAIAERMGRERPDRLRAAFRDRVAVAAVGQVTGSALAHFGVDVDILPERHRTGALVDAVAAWASAGREARREGV